MIHTRLVAACLAALVALTACTGQPAELPPDVNLAVDMKDYSIALSASTVKAGPTKIGVRNIGSMEHSFELLRTDVAPDKLPLDQAQGKAKEDGLVKQIKSIAAGKVATITADLQPGKYVILCNIAGHYQLGMRTGLTVE